MDTEAFLIERNQIVGRLHARRTSALEERQPRQGGLFGFSWWDIGRQILGIGSTGAGLKWLPQVIFSTVIPVAVAYWRNGRPDPSKPRGLWGRLAGLLGALRSFRNRIL